jgi:hypothetical protein|nr:MAG TPA: hypothetical protein [Caudoviricetes sp.]DAV44553.1 MAG TPA: hypothetical protein [Caudoviricetes sp.]
MGWRENKAIRDSEYKKKNIKRVSFEMQVSDYEKLKEQADSVPMNTFIKKALNSYTGQEIFKV